ncbi:N-acyl-L-homoserine lactone synthetase [Roseobacter phage RDJL Phi 2]|uniref:N-acyl-L-homoserine lactone synthetase n=1 Tax=Roseobacter phage RDJL Phi 2 TaxID=1682380 RepID=A0A0K0PVK2_9CAUD|nr:N-acyl-L-homoserine lactone synthetase [Roseobacter phage RDJL Phi 2]AKQ75845.1 N-acyl-L-homoserine lactone synthetase [Roseobacter phage RDJL Phi 2]
MKTQLKSLPDVTCNIAIDILALPNMKPEVAGRVFRGRKRTFIDELQWDLPDYDGSDEEHDTFDNENTRYMTIFENGELRFSSRLLTYERSMIKNLWPDYLEGVSPDAIEISRFVAHGPRSSALLSRAAFGQLRYMLRSAYKFKNIFGTMDTRIERYYSSVLQMPTIRTLRSPKYPGVFGGYWKL